MLDGSACAVLLEALTGRARSYTMAALSQVRMLLGSHSQQLQEEAVSNDFQVASKIHIN